ncbi:alpha/beta hydrolase [Acidobacteria bacterium AH-259-D05]|nr:alpha/beta hydrolase [Acidobacteria bacterium AH-259-D05]
MNLLRRNFLKQSMASLAILPLLRSTKVYGRSTQSSGAMMGNAKFVDVDGIRTRYFEGGSGEAAVLVHGGSYGSTGSADTWRLNFDGLAEHFHVYAFDRLGMGYTDNPRRDDYTMRAAVQHAYRFLQKMGIQKANLIGQSRGALPVARLAVDHPEMVKNLIIFDSNTLAPDDPSTPVDFYERLEASQPATPTKESLRRSMETNPNSYTKDHITDEYVEAVLKITLLPKLKEAKEKMQLLRSRFVERNPEKVKQDPSIAIIRSPSPWWLRDLKYETHDLIKAGRLKAPTLIIWGFNDPSAPVILGMHLLNLIAPVVPRTQFHVFNRAAHGVYYEHPREVNRLVVDFIKG